MARMTAVEDEFKETLAYIECPYCLTSYPIKIVWALLFRKAPAPHNWYFPYMRVNYLETIDSTNHRCDGATNDMLRLLQQPARQM